MIRAIEEDYWTVQYLTTVTGRGEIFWPEDGEGKYPSAESATEAATNERYSNYKAVRIVRVNRKMRFSDPINRDGDS